MDNSMPHVFRCHDIISTDIIRAAGVYLYDREGRRYADFESGIWCTALGHSHPRIVRCIADQLEHAVHLAPQFTSSLAEKAAVSLLRHTPFPNGKVVFLSSGSEAVELAIRLALLHTERHNLLSFRGSYLGAYGLAGGNTGEQHRIQIDLDGCDGYHHTGCDSVCDQLARVDWNSIAAFVLEPVLCSGGITVPPTAAVRMIAQSVTAAGGLVVADEVTTGLGRIGWWLGTEPAGLTPDIIAFGKTLGNGYPVSAVAIRRSIAASLEKTGIRYVQSHQNDPLGCVVAREVITLLEEHDVIAQSRNLGLYFEELLQGIARRASGVSHVRGMGLMLGLQLDSGFYRDTTAVKNIVRAMYDRGYIIGAKPELRLLRFMPPFVMTRDLISEMCSDLEEVLIASP